MNQFKNRFTVFALVFALSGLFFWLAINRYILPSRAQLAGNLQVVPEKTSIECNPAGECDLNILASTDPKNGLVGLTGYVQYGDGLLPVRVDKKGTCEQTSMGLDQQLQFKNDTTSKLLTFSVGSLKKNDQLKANGCITTIVFKPSNVTTDPFESKLMLAKGPSWQAGGLLSGVKGVFTVGIDESPVTVKIDSSVPVPSETPMPLPSGTKPGNCKADCNCNGRIDVADWEVIRSYVNNEGGQCDADADGAATSLDFDFWRNTTNLIAH